MTYDWPVVSAPTAKLKVVTQLKELKQNYLLCVWMLAIYITASVA